MQKYSCVAYDARSTNVTNVSSKLSLCLCASQPFHPVVNLVCSPDLRMFLCALYAPVCVVYGQVSLPCRALSQRAKEDCHRLMEIFGLTWPDGMECSRLLRQKK